MPPPSCPAAEREITLVPKMRRKGDLPHKTCQACGLPFAWRKKWARDWEAVKFCSERCRRSAKGAA